MTPKTKFVEGITQYKKQGRLLKRKNALQLLYIQFRSQSNLPKKKKSLQIFWFVYINTITVQNTHIIQGSCCTKTVPWGSTESIGVNLTIRPRWWAARPNGHLGSKIFRVNSRLHNQNIVPEVRISGLKPRGTLTTPSLEYIMAAPVYQHWVTALTYAVY